MVGPSTADAEKVSALRDALPAVGAGIYLDTPRAGPLPAESAAAMAEVLDWDVRTGRAHRDRPDDVRARIEEARAAIAAILTADLDEVAIAAGFDDALALALRTVDWRPGDRLAIVADEGTDRLVALAPPGVETVRVDAVAAIPADARLVAVPLVDGSTGERLPVEPLAAAARVHGACVVVDASLALGAVPVDRRSLGADVVVSRSEAWLLGPEGLAVAAGEGLGARQAPGDRFHLPSVVGLARAAGWLSMYVGLPWVHARGEALTAAAAARLGAIAGVELLTPPARATTLVFRVGGWPADRALDELGARVFLLAGAVERLDAIRIGIGFWTTEDELDRLASAVALLAAHTPDTLPARPRLIVLGGDR